MTKLDVLHSIGAGSCIEFQAQGTSEYVRVTGFDYSDQEARVRVELAGEAAWLSVYPGDDFRITERPPAVKPPTQADPLLPDSSLQRMRAVLLEGRPLEPWWHQELRAWLRLGR
jgi:hypothetical protein